MRYTDQLCSGDAIEHRGKTYHVAEVIDVNADRVELVALATERG